MCDIYGAQCEEPGCRERLPVHIGDFNYERDTVLVRCSKHPPSDPRGWECFVPYQIDEEDDFGAVMWLHSTAFDSAPSSEDIHPNTMGWCIATFIPAGVHAYDSPRELAAVAKLMYE